ncbi:MAG: FixH family protein [Leptospiraceae bacterium]|jgi:nitrogen fixation protein FixH
MSESMKTAFWLIGIFFTLMLIALGYTLKLALDNAEPILDETYYEKGLDYQAHIDAREKAEDLGYRIQGDVFEADLLSRGNQSISWTLIVPEGQNLNPEDVSFTLVLDQPATSRYRQIVKMDAKDIQIQQNNLVFQKEITIPRPGYWDVIVDGKAGELRFYRSQRVGVE